MPRFPQDPFRDPFRALDNIRKELMAHFGEPANWNLFQSQTMHTDIYETDTEVVVECELPGIQKKENIHIQLDGQQLTIQANIEREEKVENKNRRFFREERYYGHVSRTVTLPSPVDESSAKATYKNGVLEIRFQKAKPQQLNTIDIDFLP